MGKRIILMYISEISGHHSATIAIEKAIKTLSPETQVMNLNAFNYTNPISEKVVNRLYMTVIKRIPRIWDYLYDNPKVVKSLGSIKELLHKQNSIKFKRLFDQFQPDVVACSQAFPCGMVADFKQIYRSNMPLVAVLTDYVPHLYWIYNQVNYYVVPSSEVGDKLSQRGVPIQKIKPFGIPCDPKFSYSLDKDKICRDLGLNPKVFTILIMGGGQGLGPIKTIISSLEKLDLPVQSIVIAGSNTKLYKSLRKKSAKSKHKMLVFGYANNIHEFMTVSDIIITKPGGITTSEALSKSLPMIIIKPIPGQEANNSAYLVHSKAAIRLDDFKNINFYIKDFINKPLKIDAMRQAANAISRPNSSLDTARLLLDLS
ncbi:MAG: hypothetical protein MUF05_02840 [Candidatus Omnitrophica bacterium]|jgi:processive 1,2-diacylglycerol beta-glucosyltransferase|nr:hypothetical protein [Candidatus Omnitrophota bacterium]